MALRNHHQCFRLAAMLLLFAIACQAHSTKDSKPVNPKQYLTRFGYLNPNTFGVDEADSSPSFTDALKTFQKTFNLTVTGEFDEATKHLMEQPRCGHPDIGQYRVGPKAYDGPHLRGRILYDYYMYRWDKRHLTYAFYTNKMASYPIDVVRSIVEKVMSSWSKVSPFTFSEVGLEGNPDFAIGFFAQGDPDHLKICPNDDFDGPKHTLAHGYVNWKDPPGIVYSGLHVDSSESFATTAMPTAEQYDLESILLHELGHVLGCGHTTDEKSVMFGHAFIGQKRATLTDTDVNELRGQYKSL